MLDIKPWLEITGYKVAEERFLKPPAFPYIIFTEEINISGADNKIELYSEKIDKISEKKIEDLLNGKAIEFKKDRTWIESEKFFQTVYDFSLTEKI